MVRINDFELRLENIAVIVEKTYFLTVYDILCIDKSVRIYHVHSECACFFKCSQDEFAFWEHFIKENNKCDNPQ